MPDQPDNRFKQESQSRKGASESPEVPILDYVPVQQKGRTSTIVAVFFTIGRVLLILIPIGIVLLILLRFLVELLPWVQMARACGTSSERPRLIFSALNILYFTSVFLGGAYGVVPNRKLGHIITAPVIASVWKVLDVCMEGEPLWGIPWLVPLVVYLVTYALQNLPIDQDSPEPS